LSLQYIQACQTITVTFNKIFIDALFERKLALKKCLKCGTICMLCRFIK
jgi:uncharacterized OB-fold protein